MSINVTHYFLSPFIIYVESSDHFSDHEINSY